MRARLIEQGLEEGEVELPLDRLDLLPDWVKLDNRRFPRMKTKGGQDHYALTPMARTTLDGSAPRALAGRTGAARRQNNRAGCDSCPLRFPAGPWMKTKGGQDHYALTPMARTTLEADKRAFVRLMTHPVCGSAPRALAGRTGAARRQNNRAGCDSCPLRFPKLDNRRFPRMKTKGGQDHYALTPMARTTLEADKRSSRWRTTGSPPACHARAPDRAGSGGR
jgi:hypothetical protein